MYGYTCAIIDVVHPDGNGEVQIEIYDKVDINRQTSPHPLPLSSSPTIFLNHLYPWAIRHCGGHAIMSPWVRVRVRMRLSRDVSWVRIRVEVRVTVVEVEAEVGYLD